MTQTTADLFGSALSDIASGPHVSTQGGLTKALMGRLNENGLTIEQLSGPKIMKRSPATLKRHAREFGLVFADYIPRDLRPKRIPAAKRKMKADPLAYYAKLAAANPERTILLRLGDFYEALGEPAEALAADLGLVVTKRGATPSCGLPAHALSDHLLTLARLGRHIAICEVRNG